MAGAEDLSEDARQLREDVVRVWRLVEDHALDSDTKCMLRKELQIIEERMAKELTNATAARIRLIRGRLILAQETAELAITELQEATAASHQPSGTQAAGNEPVNTNDGNSVNITAKHEVTPMPQQAAAMVGPEAEQMQAGSVSEKQAAGKQVEPDTTPTTSCVQENNYGTLLALAEVTHAASSKAATLHLSPAAESTTSLLSARDMKAEHQDIAPASTIQPADAVQVDHDDDGMEDMPLTARMKKVAGTQCSKGAAGDNAADKDTKPSAVQQVDNNDKDDVPLAKRRKLTKLGASAASDTTAANMAGMQALLQLADACNRRVGEAADGSAGDEDVKIEEEPEPVADDDNDDDNDDGEEPGDNLCSWCDDGGMLIGCEGECWRSFHAVEGQGADGCPTLHMSLGTYEEYQTDKTKRWLCADCENEYHICYECKEYGDAAEGPKQEVFKCEYYGCGKYYHPACFTGSKAEYGRKLSARKSRLSTASAIAPDDEYEQAFFCPLHSCHTCNKPSNEPDDRLICCRRCSTAFHEQCLPRELAIATDAAYTPLKQRVWLSKEIWCLYCTLHPLLAKYGRPKTMRLLKPPDRKLQRKLQHMLEQQQQQREAQQQELLKAQSTNVPPTEVPQEKEIFDLNKPPVEVEKPSEVLPDPEALKAALVKLEQIEAKVEKEVTLEMVSKCIRRSVVYDTNEISGGRRVITSLKLRQIKQTCANAKKAWQARRFDEARQLMSHQLLRDLSSSENPLRVWLSPYMYRNRFTSFGRHFTTDQKLREVAMRMAFVIHEGDTVVDFCCGANHWSVFLAEQCKELGHRNVSFRNFDLFKAENSFCFEQRDWFEVKPGDLPPGERLVIGLNPPFGTQCALANRFVAHAVEFKPRVIVLIVPRETRHPPAMDCNGAPGYSHLEENRTLLGGHAFYIPGSYDANTNAPFSDWNKDPPSFRIYIRNDLVSQETAAWQRLDMVAPYFEEVMPPPMPGYSLHEPYFPAGFLPQ
eukprot:jgi/Chlat1/2492/Chrsp175S02363